MAITKTTTLDAITVTSFLSIEVRRKITAFDDDGSEIGSKYHRYVIDPGADVTNEPAIIRKIANAIRN